MKKLILISFLMGCIGVLSYAKPMESIENYNVLMVHGAYGTDKGVSENGEYLSSYEDSIFWGDATGLKQNSAMYCQ